MPEINIKTHEAMTLVGMKTRGKAMSGEIPQLWDQVMARAEEIPNRDYSIRAAYGVSVMEPDFEETEVFDYIAGFPVEGDPQDLPEGMVSFDIPEGTYAVITCPNLDSMEAAYESLYQRWLPEADYALDMAHGNFCFELYGEEFNPPEGSEKFYLFVPVRKK
jgi:predicted transcriptional regulator YdeE